MDFTRVETNGCYDGSFFFLSWVNEKNEYKNYMGFWFSSVTKGTEKNDKTNLKNHYYHDVVASMAVSPAGSAAEPQHLRGHQRFSIGHTARK